MKTKRPLLNVTIFVPPVVSSMGQTASGVRKQPSNTDHEKGGWRRRIRNTLLASFSLTLLYFGSASAVVASEGCFSKDSTIVTEEVSYLHITRTDESDLRSTKGAVNLMGWLYYRTKKGEPTIKDAPVLIYNHGHDQVRRQPCEIAEYFVNQGFVVFAPLRRGHSGGRIASTGVFNDEYVNKCKSTFRCQPCVSNPLACTENAYQVDYLRQQYVDVRDQIKYIRDHPSVGKITTGKLADPERIAILGHSWGGALIIFSNARLDGLHNVAIDISGAELSWAENDQPYWKSELRLAVADAKRPIYFLQPKNGKSIAPTRALFDESVDHEQRAQAAIFPPSPGASASEIHGSFIGEKEQVELWGPSVIEFINRYPLALPK